MSLLQTGCYGFAPVARKAKFTPPGTPGQQTSGSVCGSFECCYLRADEEAACRETSKINTLIHLCSGFPAGRASPGLPRQRGTLSTEQVQPQSGALTVREGAEREAAGCKTRSRAGSAQKGQPVPGELRSGDE